MLTPTLAPSPFRDWISGRVRLIDSWISKLESGGMFLTGHPAGPTDIAVLREQRAELVAAFDESLAGAVAEATAPPADPNWLDEFLVEEDEDEEPAQFDGSGSPMIGGDTDPWLENLDRQVVDVAPLLETFPQHGDCECDGTGLFAPTGNGPTSQGIQRCDLCERFAGDLDAALALAEHAGKDVSVWFCPSKV